MIRLMTVNKSSRLDLDKNIFSHFLLPRQLQLPRHRIFHFKTLNNLPLIVIDRKKEKNSRRNDDDKKLYVSQFGVFCKSFYDAAIPVPTFTIAHFTLLLFHLSFMAVYIP